jgi:hypothetical protein
MELLSCCESGIVPFATDKTMTGAVLNDGDKIQFASGAIAVQDYFAEAGDVGA